MNKYLITLICAILAMSSVAFSQDDAEYKKKVEEVRKEIWGWDIPAFSKHTIPSKYENEPGVILARHQEIKALSKSKFKFLVITAVKYKETYFTNTFREQVKLNDKATLDEYSEISYQKYKKLAKFFSAKKPGRVTILGVRIIKPNGSIQEVNTDEEVVIKNNKDEQRSKIAIPGLEVGDIIDYFFYQQEEEDVNYRTEPYSFIFGDDKPILFSSLHCEISPTCAVEYRAMNGAPEFKVKKDTDGSNILDVQMEDIAKAPVDLWMSPFRQLPILRMNIRIGGPRKIKRTAGEVYRNQPYQQIIEDVKVDMKEDFTYTNMGLVAEGISSEIKAMIKRMRKVDELPRDSFPYYIYYAFRYLIFYKVSPADKINVGVERNLQVANQKKFLLLLSLTLDKLGIQNEIILATSIYGPDAKQVILVDDFDYILKTTEGTPIYMCAEGPFTNCNYIPGDLEGQQDPTLSLKGFNKTFLRLDDGAMENIPRSPAKKNMQIENLKISLAENMEHLKIDRQTILKGQMRQNEQKRLLLFEEYYEEERKALAVKESFMEEFADSKRNRSLTDEYTSAFAKARKEQKEQFTAEITEQFEQAPKDVTLSRIDNMGLRHTKPDFIYTTQFTMDGWIKRGGNNYIIDIGKLIGGQLQLKPTQSERNVDIYMPFARTLEYNISFEIPQGYKAEGADKLAINVTNPSGMFIANAKIEGNSIYLKITKVYSNALEKATQWAQLTDIINAAMDFQSKKILLRKQ